MLKKVMRFMDIGKWIKRNASTLLTCLGAGGMVTTIALAIKVTPKAYSKVVDAKIDKAVEQEIQDLELPKLTVLEMIRVCWRDYLSTVAIGTGSLVCFFGANALSRRQQTSMAAAYTALVSAFEGYRDKVKAICGPGTDVMIEKAVEQEKQEIEDDRPMRCRPFIFPVVVKRHSLSERWKRSYRRNTTLIAIWRCAAR